LGINLFKNQSLVCQYFIKLCCLALTSAHCDWSKKAASWKL